MPSTKCVLLLPPALSTTVSARYVVLIQIAPDVGLNLLLTLNSKQVTLAISQNYFHCMTTYKPKGITLDQKDSGSLVQRELSYPSWHAVFSVTSTLIRLRICVITQLKYEKNAINNYLVA